MAQVTQDTIRLEILSEARDNYINLRNLLHVTDTEAKLCSLKIAECEAMMAEIMKQI